MVYAQVISFYSNPEHGKKLTHEVRYATGLSIACNTTSVLSNPTLVVEVNPVFGLHPYPVPIQYQAHVLYIINQVVSLPQPAPIHSRQHLSRGIKEMFHTLVVCDSLGSILLHTQK